MVLRLVITYALMLGEYYKTISQVVMSATL